MLDYQKNEPYLEGGNIAIASHRIFTFPSNPFANMQADNPFKEIIDKFQSTGKVDTVFGNPIVSKEKTLVPVSKVKYGFGGGWGKSPWIKSRAGDEQVDVEGQGIGFGGGGGIQVEPIGMVEITAESTRFMPINPQKKLIKTFVVGIIAGIILRKIFK